MLHELPPPKAKSNEQAKRQHRRALLSLSTRTLSKRRAHAVRIRNARKAAMTVMALSNLDLKTNTLGTKSKN